MHLSRLIERVERGETITIARNNRPVAVVSPAKRTPADILTAVDALRERIKKRNGGKNVLKRGDTWRSFIDEGRKR